MMESLKHSTVHVSEMLRTFMDGYATAPSDFRDLPHTSSMTSLNSEVPDQLIDADNKNTRCGYWPFIFQVLHLNLPELHWLIIGSIASLVFGGVTPVRLVKKSFFSLSDIFFSQCIR